MKKIYFHGLFSSMYGCFFITCTSHFLFLKNQLRNGNNKGKIIYSLINFRIGIPVITSFERKIEITIIRVFTINASANTWV